MDKLVIALGFFDGVHLGHGALLRQARATADRLGCRAAAITFDRHPSAVICGKKTPLITTQQEREYWIRSLYGIDPVLVLPFDRSMMQLPWQDFLHRCLLPRFDVCHLVCGWDFRFGYRGEGTAQLLQQECRRCGIGCDIIPEVDFDGVAVHSTLIRTLLQQGKIAQAAQFLGHPYSLSGPVVTGKQLGRTIGIPTANLHLPAQSLQLPQGDYATKVQFDGKTFSAVTNWGRCPTISDHEPLTVESWILDFSGDLYGKQIRVLFYTMLRKEQQFASLAALQQTVQENARQTRAYFAAQASPL